MFFTSLVFDVLQLLELVLEIYMWIVVAAFVLTWLMANKIVDKENEKVKRASELLGKLTEPVLGPVRRAVKPVNGFDLAPLVLLVILFFLRSFLGNVYVSNGVPHYGVEGSMPLTGP